MTFIFDSPETTSPIKYYFDSLTYFVSGLRFDAPDAIGGSYFFDEQLLTSGTPGGGAAGAAMFHHFQNLGIY
jgi:hypothetical protein